MQTRNHVLLGLLGLFLLGGLAWTLSRAMSGNADIPTVSWDLAEEELLEDPEVEPMRADSEGLDPLERSAVDLEDEPAGRTGGERVDVLLRGRVVDAYGQPVAGAEVSLQFGRGGRGGFDRRRIPDPVTTAGDGTFAFRGEAFRILRVQLLVLHGKHAPAVVDRNLGEVEGEVDLGDLVITDGGSVLGRITDLEGNGIAGATVQLVAEGRNPLRWVRDRPEILPELPADLNGYYRLSHVTAGDFRIQARAPRHQRGGSPSFTVEEGLETQVPDIRLGPGYELAGTVFGPGGAPVGNARVEADPDRGRDAGGRTTRDGRFFLEHLPGVPVTLRVEAEGLLTYEQEGIDPTSSGELTIRLQDGLRITGVVTDAVTGDPVTMYAIQARRVRDLPRPEGTSPDDAMRAEMQRLRQALLDMSRQGEAGPELVERLDRMRERIARQADEARERARRRTRGPRGERFSFSFDVGGRGRLPRDPGEPERHPGGAFALAGLQEGIYVVDIGSPEHVLTRTDEIELRAGGTTPHLQVALPRGFTVSGTVVDAGGLPVPGARVELRLAP